MIAAEIRRSKMHEILEIVDTSKYLVHVFVSGTGENNVYCKRKKSVLSVWIFVEIDLAVRSG